MIDLTEILIISLAIQTLEIISINKHHILLLFVQVRLMMYWIYN